MIENDKEEKLEFGILDENQLIESWIGNYDLALERYLLLKARYPHRKISLIRRIKS